MKKYNLSRIMKRAWEFVKEAGMSISSALKKSWKEAKMMVYDFKGTEKQNKWAKDIAQKILETLDNKIAEFQMKVKEDVGYRWNLENYMTAKEEAQSFFTTTEKAAVVIESKYRFTNSFFDDLENEIESQSWRRNRYRSREFKKAVSKLDNKIAEIAQPCIGQWELKCVDSGEVLLSTDNRSKMIEFLSEVEKNGGMIEHNSELIKILK